MIPEPCECAIQTFTVQCRAWDGDMRTLEPFQDPILSESIVSNIAEGIPRGRPLFRESLHLPGVTQTSRGPTVSSGRPVSRECTRRGGRRGRPFSRPIASTWVRRVSGRTQDFQGSRAAADVTTSVSAFSHADFARQSLRSLSAHPARFVAAVACRRKRNRVIRSNRTSISRLWEKKVGQFVAPAASRARASPGGACTGRLS